MKEKTKQEEKKKTLTRSELADAIIDEFRISKFDAVEVVETFFEELSEALSEGESVRITGFGTFVVRQKKERMGRNPRTMEPAIITSRKSISFKPSPYLKKLVNGKED